MRSKFMQENPKVEIITVEIKQKRNSEIKDASESEAQSSGFEKRRLK